MKVVNVTVRGGNTTEGATGVSFSVMPYEVVVQIPGSREPILSVPVVDNPMLNRQSYSFVVDGFEVDLEVQELAEEIYDDRGDCLSEEELIALGEEAAEAEAQATLNEVLGESEMEEFIEPEAELSPDNGLDTGYLEEVKNTAEETVLEALELTGEPEDSSIEAIATEHEVVAAIETAEPEAIAEIPDIIEITSSRQEAPVEEEAETAFFQRNEGGFEPVVDENEGVVPAVEEQHNAEELRHLLEQTQALLQKYDMNNVEH